MTRLGLRKAFEVAVLLLVAAACLYMAYVAIFGESSESPAARHYREIRGEVYDGR